MFDRLTDRLTSTFRKLSGGGGLTQSQIEESMKEIRRSLLEADVHFKVARDVCDRISAKAIGARVWENLQPGSQVVQIFHDELVEILGGKDQKIPTFDGQAPYIVLVCGLQGSGKTTFCAKLALYIRKKLHKTVGLLPADCARPAAKQQLQILGEKTGTLVFDSPIDKGALEVTRQGLKWARSQFFDVLLVDTAGRQQIDEALMRELSDIENELNPQEKFLVLDAMIGSAGLDVARTFHERVHLTGLCLSKLDGDSRGGVALSARNVTQVPICFASIGEKLEDLEPFFPDRMASRILGMGDVLTLVEKAREAISEQEAMDSAQKMLQGQFTLEDFRDQLRRIQNMGPLEGMLKLIPGMGQALKQLEQVNAEKEFRKIEAMINSMTRQERRNHGILNGSRKIRISKGSGIGVPEINRFLKQFVEMQRMMKQLSKLGLGGRHKMLAQASQLGKKTI